MGTFFALSQVVLLIIGPTEDSLPSRAYSAAVRYAQDLRDAGAVIYCINPGYRINVKEGQEIATNYARAKNGHYSVLNDMLRFFVGDILGGK